MGIMKQIKTTSKGKTMDCKFDLSECKTFCNEKQVYPAMRHFVNELNMSVRKASREVRRLTDGLVSDSRARDVYRERA